MSEPKRPPAGALYEIRYSEICPWLILVRSLRVSLLLRVLVLALLGVVLTQLGWAVLDKVFPESAAHLEPITHQPAKEVTIGPLLVSPDASTAISELPGIQIKDALPKRLAFGPLVRAWGWLTSPFLRSISQSAAWGECLVLMLSGLWAVAVWAVFGGAISRIAALHLTRGEMLGPSKALGEAVSKWAGTAGGPIITLVAATILALPLVLVGLLLRFDLLALVVGLLWIVALCWGLMLAVVLLGLLLGWPLMWATIGVERSDAFDCVSRCYAYIYQRPLHLVFYLVVASLLGMLGELAVEYFVVAGVTLTDWTTSWGAGNERIAQLTLGSEAGGPPLSGTANTAVMLIGFWKQTLLAFAASYPLAFLWSATVGIYLLLRRHIDSTEMDEVNLSQPAPTAGIPPLSSQEGGVAQVDSVTDEDGDQN